MAIQVRNWRGSWYLVIHMNNVRKTKKYESEALAEAAKKELENDPNKLLEWGFSPWKGPRKYFVKKLDPSRFWQKSQSYELGLLYRTKTGFEIDYRKHEEGNFVYLVCAENGLLKIGATRNMRLRMSSLITASPVKLRLAACVNLKDAPTDFERILQGHFESRRLHGEWFRLDLRTAMKELRCRLGEIVSKTSVGRQ